MKTLKDVKVGETATVARLVKTAWDGEVLASLEVQYTNVWEKYTAPVTIPDGIQALYLTYRGNGNAALRSFELS